MASLIRFKDNECFVSLEKAHAYVEFYPDANQRLGFHTGQLLHYRLEPYPEAGEGDSGHSPGPPEKLTLAFATADIALLGWRLGRIADELREGQLLAVRTLPDRYAHLDPAPTRVAQITVTPISKDAA
ncbi:MAG TPA: hypothetical protein P5186_15940 [Candidatus Paceibacterota bacterium]|nr:hypothetical protein [Verrucomicrobiota bacterium]HRY49540.1 hypothetical protein [Candidatus Paceibacterota bacterium]